MPELPEVEVARRALSRWLDGKKVVAAHAQAKSRTFRGAEVAAFERLRGPLVRAERRGKYLLLSFGSGGLLAHLGMTGKFVRRPKGVEEPHSRAQLELDSGEVVHFKDPRLFGRLEPMPVPELEHTPAVAKLGPDLLLVPPSGASLKEALGASKQPLKVALMDQERLAGLGNIHAAEALHRAKLSPLRRPASLTATEWRALATGIVAALAYALDHEDGDEIAYVEEPGSDNPFLVYGRDGERCPRCKTGRITSVAQGGRTTFFCKKCQR